MPRQLSQIAQPQPSLQPSPSRIRRASGLWLDADLGAVLGDLGYARLAPARVHCLSSCGAGATKEHFVPAAAWNGTRVDRSPLYDNRTRRYVTAYFAADFERFDFPRKPARMYD